MTRVQLIQSACFLVGSIVGMYGVDIYKRIHAWRKGRR